MSKGGRTTGFPRGGASGDEWVFALMCADVMGFAALKPKGARAIGRVVRPHSASSPQIRLAHVCIGEQRGAGVLQHYAAVFQHVAAVGNLQGAVGVLFHQKHGDALGADGLDDLEDLRNDQRRQAQRGLVQQQQARAAHQRAADGQHLLLAARHGAGALAGAILEAREQFEDMLHARVDGGAVLEKAAHFQVLGHRQVGEDAPPLGRDGDALAHDLVRGQLGDVLALEAHGAAAGARRAAEGHEQRGLARAVGADQRDDLAVVDMQAHAVHGADGAVVGGQIGLDDPFVVANGVWRAHGDGLAVLHDQDALGYAHHQAHVVLDQQHGYAGSRGAAGR
ncbi:hypothetical protein L1887_59004 [Cichorium endivia]|nr:hypothetical protein L1887_59004 [Cichorium endivia]